MCAVSVLGDVAVPAAVLPHRAAIRAEIFNQGVHAEARFLVLELAREHERCGRLWKRALGQGHEICMLRTHPIMRWVCGHRVSDRSHVSVAVRRVGRCRSVRSLLSRFLWAPRAFGSNLIKLFKGEELKFTDTGHGFHYCRNTVFRWRKKGNFVVIT